MPTLEESALELEKRISAELDKISRAFTDDIVKINQGVLDEIFSTVQFCYMAHELVLGHKDRTLASRYEGKFELLHSDAREFGQIVERLNRLFAVLPKESKASKFAHENLIYARQFGQMLSEYIQSQADATNAAPH
ncbi:hypothetical protein HYS31_06365 [Candidatus Woesearchaeota archaeon]|nr:hypothetical protein [Candidatus Woesearchaeota archaeon]